MKGSGQSGNSKKRNSVAPRTDSFLESLRDIGGSSAKSVKKDFIEGVPKDFVRQLFGVEKPNVRASGEIQPGETLEIERVMKAESDENKQLKAQLQSERRLREEEKVHFEKKSQELKVELHALVQEVQQLAKTTSGLSQEVEIATMQAPANPGIYHVIFFEKLREFIQSFRKKIENASIWMQNYNQRAAKQKTFWGQVGKSGSKRLLSPEDYLQRSAG